MKRAAIGVLAGVGLGMLACLGNSSPETAFAQHSLQRGLDGGLESLSTQLPDGRQQLAVVDPHSRVIAVYHVDPSTGEVSLKSVRNIYWDLQMIQFNSANPLPQEIRSLLQQN